MEEMLQQELALSRGDTCECHCFPCLTDGSQVSWAFLMKIFWERIVLAVLLTDSHVRTVHTGLISLLQPSRSWIPSLSWLDLLSLW